MNKVLKKYLFFLFFLSFLFLPNFSFAWTSSTSDSGIFSILKQVNQDKANLSEKQSLVKYEEESIEDRKSKIEELQSLTSKLQESEEAILTIKKFYTWTTDISQNKDYQEKEKTFNSILADILKILSTSPNDTETLTFTWYTSEKTKIKRKIDKKVSEMTADNSTSEESITKTREEIKTLSEELQKSEATFQSAIQDLIVKIIIFIFSIAFLIFFWKFLKKFIRSRPYLSEESKVMFILIVRWIRNSFAAIITFVFFFSEFVSILPFLAIIGTALWLALRDIIASFIARFTIGLKDGMYKVSDIIEIENYKIFWRVVKISPLTTVVQELWMSGASGTYLSFPNKTIFEASVKNYSRLNSWLYLGVDFFLDATSDIIDAKLKLKTVLDEIISSDRFRSPLQHKSFFKKMGYPESSIQPQIFLEARPQGVMLRGKVMTLLLERNDIRTFIIENFITQAKENPDIKILSIWQDKV